MTYSDPTFGKGAAVSASISELQKLANNSLAAPDPTNINSKSNTAVSMGTWFDPSLDLRDPEGDALTTWVLSQIAEVEARRRKLKQRDAQNRYALVRSIIANGYRCHLHRDPPLVACSRRAGGYPDGPDWLNGRSMARIVDILSDAGLINANLGRRGCASTYQLTPDLMDVALACGVTEHSLVCPLPTERLVRLREGGSGTPYLTFEQTKDTCRWTSALIAYNAVIRQQDIALDLTDVEQAAWVRHWNEERLNWRGGECPVVIRPERFKTDLYRQFNNGSFDQGGRLYGGWWINTPGWLRKRIKINGQSTVELDYSGCHIRMLYHQRGIDYEGDPYRLDELTACEKENGLPSGYFREGIKVLIQALINGNPEGRPQQAKIRDFSFKPYFTRPELRQLIEEKHAPIADSFGIGEGLRLQRTDSDIALSVITRLLDLGVVALPVHDSFIVASEEESDLLRVMDDEYISIFQHRPVVKN